MHQKAAPPLRCLAAESATSDASIESFRYGNGDESGQRHAEGDRGRNASGSDDRDPAAPTTP
jgi:hypothetical protein